MDALGAIGRIPSLSLKRECIQWGVESVRSQDIFYVFGSVASSVAGARVAWEFITENFEMLSEKYSTHMFNYILGSAIRGFQTKADADMVLSFIDSNGRRKPSMKRMLEASIEGVNAKAVVVDREAAALKAYFQK